MNSINLFGKINAPPLSGNNLTASYESAAIKNLFKALGISMFWNFPETEESIELPNVSLTTREEDLWVP